MSIQKIGNFAKNEWLLLLAFTGMMLTSLALQRIPKYSISDAEILYILLLLLIVTQGLQRHGVISTIAAKLEQGQWVAVKMVAGTFFLSMIVTNDVALLALVPLTLLLHIENLDYLVILEILAANAGSALSPFGNPQNLFIYWFYQVPFQTFLEVIFPFSALFFLLLLGGAFFLDAKEKSEAENASIAPLATSAYLYLGMLLFVVLIVLRILPLYAGAFVLLYAALFDRPSLRVDYALLATFACFFGFTDNLQILLSGALSHAHHVFLLGALLSQGISNVPAALLLADFTNRWQALLWGVSVGGFGSLVASLANLIAYRIYTRERKGSARAFTLKFHALSYAAFFVGILLYSLKFILK